MSTEYTIRHVFHRQGVNIAERHRHFQNQWSANSQYGYCLELFDTKEEAEKFTLGYYKDRMNLILQ